MGEDNKFYKYPDIENSYQEGFIEKIRKAGYEDCPYMITEKIHGANSQITYNVISGEFSYGSRSHFLAEGEKFYNLQGILDSKQEAVKVLAGLLSGDLAALGQRVKTVTVYGEVFGGAYPHPDVVLDKTANKVQKGVYYCPSNDWLAFDVSYTVIGSDKNYFLGGDKFFSMCVCCGVDTVPMLVIAKNLTAALAYKDDMPSRVYRKYRLPKLDDNIMEGIVIRPASADVWLGDHRVILKKKNEKFKEKKEAKKNTEPVALPEGVAKACEEISQFITVNRVHNVISHIGEVGPKDVGRVIMETAKDVLADYRKEYDTLDKLEKKDEKLVTKFMNGEVAKIVRDVVIFGKG